MNAQPAEGKNPGERQQSALWVPRKTSLGKRILKNWPAYLFLVPMTIWWLVFQIYPMVRSYKIVLYDWRGVGEVVNYVGFDNFKQVATDPYFWKAFKNSFLYAGFQVPIQLFLALALAIILNARWLKGQSFFRAVFYVPSLVSTTIVALIVGLMLNPYNGVVNVLLLRLGFIDEAIPFLEHFKTSFPTIIAVGVWQTLGINMVYFLAALQTIPTELYEASSLDGAKGRHDMIYITLPLIRPVFLLVLLLAALGSLNVMELVFVLTGGGPYFQTDVVQTYIYKFAFVGAFAGGQTQVGFASASALFMSLILLFLTALQIVIVRRLRKTRGEYGI